MAFQLTWLASVLRAAGLRVIEEPGWQNNGRAEMHGPVQGVILHHTAGPPAPRGGKTPSLNVIKNGRPDLNGPLSQLYLSREGVYHVIAAGRTNHAGKGAWQGITDGNDDFIGIEAENAGVPSDPWPHVQMDAYVRGVAALLKHMKKPRDRAIGHREWALPRGRKSDPSFDMTVFRVALDKLLA